MGYPYLGECIIAAPDNASYAGSDAVRAAWSRYAVVGAMVPEYVLSLPDGSRADLAHAAT